MIDATIEEMQSKARIGVSFALTVTTRSGTIIELQFSNKETFSRWFTALSTPAPTISPRRDEGLAVTTIHHRDWAAGQQASPTSSAPRTQPTDVRMASCALNQHQSVSRRSTSLSDSSHVRVAPISPISPINVGSEEKRNVPKSSLKKTTPASGADLSKRMIRFSLDVDERDPGNGEAGEIGPAPFGAGPLMDKHIPDARSGSE